MARGRNLRPVPRRRTKRKTPTRSFTRRYRASNLNVTSQFPFLSFLRFVRTAASTLPIGNVSKVILGLFDFGFDLIFRLSQNVKYYTGAYSMIGVSPAALLSNSPLLAKNGGEYSFPGFPVSLTSLTFKIRNTTKLSEHSGRWAVVFIPYRETHDATHYTKKLADVTFSELCAMPYSKSASASTDIQIKYRMRDKTSYCARPREITEEIGIVLIIWDTSARDETLLKSPLNNIDFNCEMEISGGCKPHVIFGPSHRNNFAPEKFQLRSITKADSVRVHFDDETIRFYKYSDFTDDFIQNLSLAPNASAANSNDMREYAANFEVPRDYEML